MAVSRRIFLRSLMALCAWQFAPRFNMNTGGFSLLAEAEAAWFALLQLALNACSMFVNSDRGMSAMLANIREMQQETITLMQTVVTELGKVQGALQNLPSIIHEQLIEHDEYRVREETESIRLDLAFCEARRKEGDLQRKKLNSIVEKATNIARLRSVPYGRGATAAFCAPLVASIDARARQLLGKRNEIATAVVIYYLPWLQEIQSQSEGSLYQAILKAGSSYDSEVNSIEESMPPLLKQYLGKEFFLRALELEPGNPPLEKEAGCGSYDRITAYKNGNCLESRCTRGLSKSPMFSAPQSLVEQGIAVQEREDILSPFREGTGGPPDCWCVRYEHVPVTKAEASIRRIVAAINGQTKLTDTSKGQEPGPHFSLSQRWEASKSSDGCSQFLVGTSTGDRQIVDLKSSKQAQAWESDFNKFVQGKIARINEYRRMTYAMYQLLSSVRSAQNLLIKVTT